MVRREDGQQARRDARERSHSDCGVGLPGAHDRFRPSVRLRRVESVLYVGTRHASAVAEPGLSALAQLGQVVYGFHADPAGRVLLDHVSPGLESLLGRPLPDDPQQVAAIWSEAIHAADRVAEAGFMAAILAGEQRWVVYRIARPDGEIAWLVEHGTPVPRADGLAGGTAIVSAAPSLLVDVLARNGGERFRRPRPPSRRPRTPRSSSTAGS